MIPIYIFIGVIALILILGIVFKAVKLALKIISLVFLVTIVSTAVFGYFVYQDFKEFQETNKSTLLLLEHNKEFIAGISTESEEDVIFLNAQELEKKTLQYDEDLESYNQEIYRSIIFDKEYLLEILPENLEIMEENISKENINNILKAEDSLAELMSIISEHNIPEEDIPEEINGPGKARGFIFILSAANIMNNPKNIKYIIKGFKEGTIRAEPESPMFKAIKFVPISMIDKISEKLNDGIIQKKGSS